MEKYYFRVWNVSWCLVEICPLYVFLHMFIQKGCHLRFPRHHCLSYIYWQLLQKATRLRHLTISRNRSQREHMLAGSAQKVAVNTRRQRRQLDTLKWKAWRQGVPRGVYPGPKCGPLFELRTGAFNKEGRIIRALWGTRENIKVQEFTMWPFESNADQMPGLWVKAVEAFIG